MKFGSLLLFIFVHILDILHVCLKYSKTLELNFVEYFTNRPSLISIIY